MRRAYLPLALLAMTSLSTASDLAVRRYPNGLTWIHRQVKHNRISAFHLLFPGGVLQETPEKVGLTHLMGEVMFKGTQHHNAREISEALENLGASLGATTADDYWGLSGQSVDEAFPALWAVTREVLTQPTFPEDEFRKEQRAVLNALEAKKEHIFQVAYDRLNREVFGAHPYAWPEEGLPETVARMTARDVADWHRQRARPRGAVLVTITPDTPSHLEKLVADLAEGWPDAGELPPAPPRPVYGSGPVVVEERHPFEQGYVMLAAPAPGIQDSLYPAVKLLNVLLGSGMSSPLFRVVREEAGLAYETSSFFPSRRWGSAFVVYAGTDPGQVAKAEAKIRSLCQDFSVRPPTEEELRDARRFLLGHYRMDHQTNSRLAWYLAWWELNGLGFAFDQTYPSRIEAVTPQSVQEAARQVLGHPFTVVRILPSPSTSQ